MYYDSYVVCTIRVNAVGTVAGIALSELVPRPTPAFLDLLDTFYLIQLSIMQRKSV